MPEKTARTYLIDGTILEVSKGVRYVVQGEPLGEGGGSIIYAAKKFIADLNGEFTETSIDYAIKECFPVCEKYEFTRDEAGCIVPIIASGDRVEDSSDTIAVDKATDDALRYLDSVKRMQREEGDISGRIFNVSIRTTPVLESYDRIRISTDGGASFNSVDNLISILGSLAEKGRSVRDYLNDAETVSVPAAESFRIIEQLLFALREVHNAGYLHLDIQDGNVYLQGALEDNSNIVSLLDFGTARALGEDGLTDEISDQVIFSTQGFTAPEMLSGNDGTLKLGPQADIFSAGALLLMLLTGRRYSSQELINNSTGHYIPRFAIRKTKCPKHLTDRMQEIIAKSLKADPAERYQTADAMLEDVSAFIKDVAPFRNPLTSSSYEAFICYRHNELDNVAARELRDSLERFKASVLEGEEQRPIGPVFLDEGELSSCADFGERIRDALKNSEWLIVICSGTTGESKWVNDEIRTFLEFHDKSHVLAVVTDGEPSEVFPKELRKCGLDETNLLAADARADGDIKKTAKNIRGDVTLKIAASILGTTYDTLKQRRKMYELRRRYAIAGVALLVVLAFTVLALVNAQRINREHIDSIYNQAIYMADKSEESFDAGDAFESLEMAVSASDLMEEVGYVLPKSIDDMCRAMNLYRTNIDAGDNYLMKEKMDLEGYSDYGFLLIDDGEYIATRTFKDGIYIWDAKTYELVGQLQSIVFTDGMFPGEHRCIVSDGHSLKCIDYLTNKELWSLDIEDVMNIRLSEDGSKAAIVRETSEFTGTGTDTELVVDSEVLLYDFASGTSQTLLESTMIDNDEFIYDAEFCGDKLLLAEHRGLTSVLVSGSAVDVDCKTGHIRLNCYSANSGALEWSNEYESLSGASSYMDVLVDGNEAYFLYDNSIARIRLSDGASMADYQTVSPIQHGYLRPTDGNLAVVLQNGYYGLIADDHMLYRKRFRNNVAYHDISGDKTYVQYGSLDEPDSSIVVYQAYGEDPNAEIVKKKDVPEDLYIESFEDISEMAEPEDLELARSVEPDDEPIAVKRIDKNRIAVAYGDHAVIYDARTDEKLVSGRFRTTLENYDRVSYFGPVDDNCLMLALHSKVYLLYMDDKQFDVISSITDAVDLAYSPSQDAFYYLDHTADGSWYTWNEEEREDALLPIVNKDNYKGDIVRIPRHSIEEIKKMAKDRLKNRKTISTG